MAELALLGSARFEEWDIFLLHFLSLSLFSSKRRHIYIYASSSCSPLLPLHFFILGWAFTLASLTTRGSGSSLTPVVRVIVFSARFIDRQRQHQLELIGDVRKTAKAAANSRRFRSAQLTNAHTAHTDTQTETETETHRRVFVARRARLLSTLCVQTSHPLLIFWLPGNSISSRRSQTSRSSSASSFFICHFLPEQEPGAARMAIDAFWHWSYRTKLELF